MADRLRFYLDENVPVEVASQLSGRGTDIVTARDIGTLGVSDIEHLARATASGYVLCTHDTDFLRIAAQGIEHTGIVFGQQSIHTIGDWVCGLALLHTCYYPHEMVNRIEFL